MQRVASRVLPSVVQVRVTSGADVTAGSGIILNPDGLILTNNHVIVPAAHDAGQLTLLFHDGTSAPAAIVAGDPSSDVAVVQARGTTGLTPITFADSDSLRVGQDVLSVGSPLGLGDTITTGIISALHRAVDIADDSGAATPEVLDAIQTDAAINPGNSGGALVNTDGQLIGVNTAYVGISGPTNQESGSAGLGFAIPSNLASRILHEIDHGGQATKPVLGVKIAIAPALELNTDTSGARIISLVPPNGPATQAGLHPGDTIVELDDRIIATGNDLLAAIREHNPGDTVTLQLSNGRRVPVVLGFEAVPSTK
jgi:putative serine protease PepD